MEIQEISTFSGTYRWLSNFWPCTIYFEGEVYKSVEAAYVASKTEDEELRLQIRNLETPGQAKRFGYKLQLSNSWKAQRLEIMEYLLSQKFKPGSDLAKKLLATGSVELIETNVWGDTFWGVCDGKGDNNLGKLLMKIRSELK